MSNPWSDIYKDLRAPYLQEKKGKSKDGERWQDDDCDGKWYEKSDVDGKISDREKKEKKKHYNKEAVVQEDLSKIKDTLRSKGKDLVTNYKKFYSKTPQGRVTTVAGKVFNKVKDAVPLVVGVTKKLAQGKTGDGYIGHKSLGIRNPLVKKEHHQKDADGKVIEHEDTTPSSVEENKKFGPGGDPIKKQGFIDKALDKLKKNTPVKKVDKAHYEPDGKVVVEALKGKKLEVQETGVKNKIEINPEIKTEAANAPVKK